MKTTTGLTVVSSSGLIRIPKSKAEYLPALRILESDASDAIKFEKISSLLVDTLSSLREWATFHGFSIEDNEESLFLNGEPFSRDLWHTYFHKLCSRNADPKLIFGLRDLLQRSCESGNTGLASMVDASNLCVLQPGKGYTSEISILRIVNQPRRLSKGDRLMTPGGVHPHLVAYSSLQLTDACTIVGVKGVIVSYIDDLLETNSLMQEPVILGNNATYRCQEKISSDWVTDLSFDSYEMAKRNAKEIENAGGLCRIINMTTELPVQ